MTCKHCRSRGDRWSEALEEMRRGYCQTGTEPPTADQVEKGFSNAVGFLGEFEDDGQQQLGLVDALNVLRAAMDQGYRLIRAA